MERIERALEVARLHRQRLSEVPAAPSFAAMVTPELAPAPPVPPAEMPLAELADRQLLRERYVIFPDEPGPAALAYKMLRTQVLQRARQRGMRCIGIVSAASGEGKTVTAINLGLSLALEPNQSVVLVDLDLKRPKVADTLMMKPERGLEAYFAGGAEPESLWQRFAGFERLAILPTLTAVPGSSEVLAGEATSELVRRLRDAADQPLVLFDLPPVLLSDDVLAVAPLLDGVVLVVAEEQTRREDLQRVFELLRETPVIGTVLNASAEAEVRAY